MFGAFPFGDNYILPEINGCKPSFEKYILEPIQKPHRKRRQGREEA